MYNNIRINYLIGKIVLITLNKTLSFFSNELMKKKYKINLTGPEICHPYYVVNALMVTR